ncbi:ABC transporter substrate-binding protein [Nitrospira moscoviensis]|uniref:Putative Leu/Ile/Val-binding protein, periplasmic-binding component of ABC transport system n=1 Tax=Nitrospira moscoviensis TaxID=42253 RepID=A0A0K2G7P8_NITMO|nr:ABC transporter substrate-binding protein [Nitrospira moscoviensis]ALA56637.1 putative Leu/Ile/Val-binding protein, periplasmic-binding component of ABC transport system [Nitrospira moscoviensis]
MRPCSRRRFLEVTAATGGALLFGDLINQVLGLDGKARAAGGEPIKVGIIDPLSSPYKTSSIHDVHGANVAVDLYNKRGGVLGRQVVILEADDASSPEQAVKAATKFIKDDRVDFLMGTFNADCALAVSEVAKKENKLFMVTASHEPALTGAACNSHTFVFMPNAVMLAKAVVPQLAKAYGTRWYMLTTGTLDGKAMAQAIVAAGQAHGVEFVGEALLPFGATDFTSALTAAKDKHPTLLVLNLYGWDLVNALKGYTKLELAKDKIGVGGLIGGEQIGRPLGYANNAGVWGLIWDPKINTDGSKRFIQGVIDKYNHTPTSRCYLGYAAMMQILEAVRRAGTTDTAAVIKALEGHEFDGLKEGRSYFRAWDHQHVQDVLVGEAFGKEMGLGHYKILATVPGDAVAGTVEQNTCKL